MAAHCATLEHKPILLSFWGYNDELSKNSADKMRHLLRTLPI
jgi:hypothetical protein